MEIIPGQLYQIIPYGQCGDEDENSGDFDNGKHFVVNENDSGYFYYSGPLLAIKEDDETPEYYKFLVPFYSCPLGFIVAEQKYFKPFK